MCVGGLVFVACEWCLLIVCFDLVLGCVLSSRAL